MPANKDKVESSDVLAALSAKHRDDIFIPECNNGPTGMDYRRIDAWVMNRSWVRMNYVGYEIKVSRSDFLQDKKWVEYLPMCNQLYFATPRGLLNKSEIPMECGLVELVGGRVLTRKLAPKREIAEPVQILQYVLMNRVEIIRPKRESGREYWKQWLKDAEDDRKLGYQVRQKLSDITLRIHSENQRLAKENESLTELKKCLDKLGLSAYQIYSHTVESRVQQLLSGIPADAEHQLARIKSGVESILVQIETLKAQAGAA